MKVFRLILSVFVLVTLLEGVGVSKEVWIYLESRGAHAERFKELFYEDLKRGLGGDYELYESESPLSLEDARRLLKKGADWVVWGSVSSLSETVLAVVEVFGAELSEPAFLSSYGPASTKTWFEEKVVRKVLYCLKGVKFVEEVRVSGNLRVDDEVILEVVSVRPNEVLSPLKVRRDIKAIYRLGYFEEVAAELERRGLGYVLTYVVKERPVIAEVKFKGNKAIKASELKKVIDIKPFSILNPERISQAIEVIKALYEQKGYFYTEVRSEVKPLKGRRVELVFHIKEGRRLYIKSIEFEGNKAFSDEELRSLMSLTVKTPFSWLRKVGRVLKSLFVPGPVVSPGVFSRVYLYRDLNRILTFYHDKGFIEARVGEPRVEESKGWVRIVIPVEEGPRYRVGKVEVEQKRFPEKKVYELLRLPKLKFFSRRALREDQVRIATLFADKGYAYVKVEPKLKKDPKTRVINVKFVVNEGPLVYINRIEVVGNTRTRDKVIRRELLLVEQRPFSATRLRSSERRLLRLGYFEEVVIEREPGVREDQMDLRVRVKEQPTGTFSIAAGYSSVEKFMLMAQVSQRNFLGRGQTVSFQGLFSEQTTRYTFSFLEPYLLDTRISLYTSLYKWSRVYSDFTRKSKGGGFRFGYALTPNSKAFVGYKYDDTQLEDLDATVSDVILRSKDVNITSALQLSGIYDTRNRWFSPTKGQYHRLSLDLALRAFGSESEYLKAVLKSHYFFPLVERLNLHFHLGAGYLTEGPLVPVFERFFLGGIYSVRGFRYGAISPVDEVTGDRIGGTRMFYLQNELVFTLVRSINLKFAVFYDLGTVWDEAHPFDWNEVREGVGFGFRWLSPIGPLRIEFGWNIDRRPGEDANVWDFQIGGIF